MAKRKFSPDYTEGDILGLYQQRSSEGDEGRLRGLATEFRKLTRLEHEVEIPAQYKKTTRQVRTPFIRDAAHRITSSLVAKAPIPHVQPKDEAKQPYREAANTAERFDVAMIERLNKERGTDICYNLTYQLVRDGESVLKVVHRPDAWANFPEGKSKDEQDDYKKGVDLPIAWRDVDRMSVVYEGGEYGDEWVIEYGEYTKPYLRSKYRLRGDDMDTPSTTLEGKPYPEGLNPSTAARAVKLEFFTAREWHVIINGKEAPGYPKANPYAPYLPYFRAPAYDSESLLYSLLFLVPRLDELLTMKLNHAVLTAYATPVLNWVAAGQQLALNAPLGDALAPVGEDGKGKVSFQLGKLFEAPFGRSLSYLEPPSGGKDLNDLIGIYKSLIDIAGIPSVMRGTSGAGDSGYLASQLRAAAQMAYKLAALALQRQLEKATEFSHWLVCHVIKQTVYVQGWSEINPKTGRPIKGAQNAWLALAPDGEPRTNVAPVDMLGPVTYQYRPLQPTELQAQAMIALQLTNAKKPLFSLHHALEELLQEEDADSILEEITVEQALSEEPLRSIWIDAALRKAGLAQPQQPNPAAALVGPNGMPLVGGPMSPGMQGVPMANAAPPGVPGVPGLTMPLQPGVPQPPAGIPGQPGGRPAGMYPGQPGGPHQQ